MKKPAMKKTFLLLVLFASQLPGQNWPSFRGPAASGIAEGSRLLTHWDVLKGEGILWKTPIPGLAHSSPVIWGDRIFVMTALASDQNQKLKIGQVSALESSDDTSRQSWRVYCLSRNTGKVLWEKVAQEAQPRVPRHPKTTHASATPAIDGKRIIVLFASGGLYCYDLNGKLQWSQDLGVLNANWGDKPEIGWGPASSPIIYRNLVIVLCDVEKDPHIAAYDIANGKKVWSTPRKTISSWSTPTVYEGKEHAELVVNGSEDVRGYDPRTGIELWSLRPTSRISIPTPFAAQDIIFVASGYGRGIQPIYAILGGSRGDITLKEGEVKSDRIAWSAQKGAPYITTPIVYRDYLYIAGYNGIFSCYKAKTGEKVYDQRLGTGGFFSSSPVAGDGKIYAISEDGDAYVIKAGPKFELVSTNPMGEIVMATPALSRGMMIVRTQSQIVALGAK
jgi:outer membrane protein assembly factor BamB